MTDETTEVVAPEGGEQTKPKVSSSPEGEAQPSPGSASELEALSKRVGELDGMLRALQSDKDKGVAKVQKQVTEMQDELERYYELRSKGVTEQDARKSLILDEIIAERMGVSERVEEAPQPVPTSDERLKPALALAGLSANDPEVIEILRTSPVQEQINRIVQLGLSRKQAQAVPASPGAAMSTGGGGAVPGETLESVEAELKAELAKPVKNHTKLSELRRKHEELLKQ